MSISFVEKTSGGRIANSRVALVLAGGAVSGGAFKLGGLKALNDYFVNRKMTDFDLYVGLSAGALLSASLANNVPPEEMLRSLDGKSESYSQLKPWDFYWPNFREFVTRPLWVATDLLAFSPVATMIVAAAKKSTRDKLLELGQLAVREPSYSNIEAFLRELGTVVSEHVPIPDPLRALIPSGLFDNHRLEAYLRHNLHANHGFNDFRTLKNVKGKELYICATNLDTAERAIFGHDEIHTATISQSVAASTAIPGFYRPVRIGDNDYVDGSVRKTANIDVAIEKGADLVICYNPFRPIQPDATSSRRRRLADEGMTSIINQVFRTLLHTRLQIGMERYANDPTFKGDIILIEPRATDADFFDTNPLAFWKRSHSARMGFESVIRSVEDDFERLRSILRRHGIELSRHYIEHEARRLNAISLNQNEIMRILEEEHPVHNLHVAS